MLKINANAHVLMLLSVLIASSSFPVGKLITHDLPPAVLMFIRFLLAAILFAPFVFIKNGLKFPPWKRMLSYSILSIPPVIFFWSMFEGLRYTSVINTGALITLIPAITAIWAIVINREIPTLLRTFGLAIGTIGALLVVFKGDYIALFSLKFNHGDVVFIMGILLSSWDRPLLKRLYSGEPIEILTFWTLFLGAGWLLLASMNSTIIVDWQSAPSKTYGGILYLAIFTTLITFFIRQKCTVLIGATKVAAYSLMMPVFVILLTFVTGMESFELATLPGILLVIISMFLIQRDPSRGELSKIT
jgi:drug/metabolite transporter (DMT)-like permease